MQFKTNQHLLLRIKIRLNKPADLEKKNAHVLKFSHNRIIYCFLDWKIAHHFNKHKHTVDWLCQQILHVCACISIIMITLTGRCSLGGECQVLWFCRLCWIFFFSQLFEIKSFISNQLYIHLIQHKTDAWELSVSSNGVHSHVLKICIYLRK